MPRAWLIAGIPLMAFAVTAVLALARDSGVDSRAETAPAASVVVQRTQATATAAAPSAPTALPDRTNCDEIRGDSYRSAAEREWYLANCRAAQAAAPGANQATGAASTGTQNANAVASAQGTGPGPIYGTGDRLVVTRLGINAPVNARSVGTNGVMGDPAGPTDVVWYDFGSLGLGGYPGAGGNAVFAGHVDYRGYGPAVFYQLRNVQEGDIVEYYTASGAYFKYQVISFGDYAPDANWASIVSGSNELTMITCNGDFNSAVREYSHRRVVKAVLVS